MIVFGDKIFKNPVKIIKAFTQNELFNALEEIETLKKDFYMTGYIRYEAFNADFSAEPLLYFEVFGNLRSKLDLRF